MMLDPSDPAIEFLRILREEAGDPSDPFRYASRCWALYTIGEIDRTELADRLRDVALPATENPDTAALLDSIPAYEPEVGSRYGWRIVHADGTVESGFTREEAEEHAVRGDRIERFA